MGGGANLYSIEAISDALIGAGSIAANSQDEQQIIRGYLTPLKNILQAECAAFFSSEASQIGRLSAIAVQEPGEPLQLPASIDPLMESFIRSVAHQTTTSSDPEFMLGYLRSLAGACASSASMWGTVPAGECDFGSIAVFDRPPREFGRVEQQVLRTFSLQLSYALKNLVARKQKNQQPAKKSSLREVDRYIESTKHIGSVSRDLINPLTAIMGYVDLLKAEGLDERSRQYIAKLQAQTEKMQDIVMALNSAPAPRIVSAEAEEEQFPIPSAIALVPALPVTNGAPPKGQRSASGRSRVLIVQKSEAVAEFEKTVLSALNAEVITVASGVEALTMLQSADVHAVIIDDELEGEWRGKKLFGWIQENRPDLSKRLLITISQHPRDEIKEMVEKLGVAHVTKPLQIMDLFAGMREMLGFTPEALDKRFLN